MRYPPLSPIQHAAYRLAALLAFNRITLIDHPALPPGLVLYLGRHRNGEVGGAPYVNATPRAVSLGSAQ